MHPSQLSITDFTYTLPEAKIALHPLAERDASRLLVYRSGILADDHYRNLAEHIPAHSLLVFNNTKVVEARLLFEKSTGATIEIFCLEPANSNIDIASALQQTARVQWRCLLGGASKWKHGQVLEKEVLHNEQRIILTAHYVQKIEGAFIIELSWTPLHFSFAEVLHFFGAIPLPPYIKRKAAAEDEERYQTIFAQQNGSVAAPTAALHFTSHIMQALTQKKIDQAFVTLHVGAGTFKPVKAATMGEHDMHSEFISVTTATIRQIIAHLDTGIIAVGTTSLRTIESLYWLGVKLMKGQFLQDGLPELDQWEPYELPQTVAVPDALHQLLAYLESCDTTTLSARTKIIIAPGYNFKIINALVTNFHQPQSTLLLLVAALIGDDWKKIYAHALAQDYRFLSYGDGSLLWKR